MNSAIQSIFSREVLLVILTALVSSGMTYFFTRRSNHVDDYRQGMKDIDEAFYKPFISLYWNAHHAYAYYFVDLPIETQDKIINLLLENQKRVPPWIERQIWDLDQCYSGYREDVEQMLDEEKKFVEDLFWKIYRYVEKAYVSNERKLYHTAFDRLCYWISERSHQFKVVLSAKRRKNSSGEG